MEVQHLPPTTLDRRLPTPPASAPRTGEDLARADAKREFEAALAIEPNSPLAANNVAVCQLYCCRLNDAVSTLQDQLKRDPHANMHEVLVSNLANLYQMTSPTSGGSNKQALERLVMAVAGDDFDESVLNLGQ